MIHHLTMGSRASQRQISINLNALIDVFAIAGKNAQQKKWYKDLHTYYKNYANSPEDYTELALMDICYDIYNGQGWNTSKRINSMALKKANDNNLLVPKNVKFRHFPIIAPVIQHRIGLRKSKPLRGVVIDTSGYSMNMAKRAINNQIANWLNETVVTPVAKQIEMEELQKAGVTDIYSLSPEDRQQLNSQTQDRLQQEVPVNIFDRFTKDYRSPLEEDAASFFEWLKNELNMDYLLPESYKHLLVAGRGPIKIDIKHGKIKLRVCNPRGHKAFLTENQHFFEDADANVYEDTISPVEFYTDYYENLSKDDKGKMAKVPQDWRPHGTLDDLQGKYIATLGQQGVFKQDTRTIEGMDNWIKHLGHLGHITNDLYGIRRTTTQIRGGRYLKKVLRMEKETGEAGYFYIDESYTKNEAAGDISVELVRVPEVYNIEELGNGIFANMGPLPYQYNSLDDPFEVRSQFYGSPISRMFGNSGHGWPMMKGLSYQFAYDMHQTLLDRDIAKNMGVVLQMMSKAIPSNMTPSQFASTLKSDKILLVDHEGMGLTPDALNSIRAINLSNTIDVAERRQHLAEIRENAVMSMNYNFSLLGTQSQYMAAKNVESSIDMANMQILSEETLQDKIEENLCNGILRIAQRVYRKNPPVGRFLGSDGGIMNMELQSSEIWNANLNVKVSYNYQDIQDLEKVRNAIIQQSASIPGYLEPDEFVEVFLTKSIARLQNISLKASKRRKEQEAQQQQMQQQMAQAQLEAAAKQKEQDNIHEANMLTKRLETDRYKADIQGQAMNRGFDVDQDGIDNMTEAKTIEMAAKERMHKIDAMIEMAKNEVAKKKAKETFSKK